MPTIGPPALRGGKAAKRMRYLAVAATTGILLAAGLPGGTAEAAKAKTWVVKPGQSIQKVVNRARSGDTIQIKAGTFAEAVCVVGKGLTVKGAGATKTILVPPKTLTKTKCWTPGAPEGGTVEGVSAIKFLNPSRRVVVSDLQTRNFPESGIVAWKARGFTVKRTQNIGHRQYGILATADSRRISITDNIQVGVVVNNRSGTAGISVADSAKAKAVIKRNVSVGWNLGIFLRESRGGLVQHNTVKGNCGGVLIFDDSNTEKPNQTGTVIGGAWTVKRNSSIANNRLCYAGRDGSLRVSGVGMAVVNADRVKIIQNLIKDNRPVPNVDLNFPAAGLDILTVPSPTGGPNPGPATKVSVISNRFVNNEPLDILVGPGTGPGNVFKKNSCGASNPPAICAPPTP